MISVLFFLPLILHPIHGKFLTNAQSSAFVLLRHVRLPTDDEQHQIRCPYNANHLTLQLLNYSNDNCFNLYSTSGRDACQNHQSPCQFHAKSVPLRCASHSYSEYVDISYQCSYKTITSPPKQRKSLILHALSFPTNLSDPEESLALFLITLSVVITLWLLICCLCLVRCRHRHRYDRGNETAELLSYPSYPKVDHNLLSKKNNSNMVDNICLHVNPFETNRISSPRTTRFTR